jgi:phosphate transport system permease protein
MGVADRFASLRRSLGADSPGDLAFLALAGAFAAALLVLFLYIVWILGSNAWPAVRGFGVRFLVSRDWDPDTGHLGAFVYIVGTLASSLLAVAIVLPVAVGTAVALAILLPRAVAAPLGVLVELLAAVPSIIFGIWGLAVIAPFVRRLGEGLGQDTFGPSVLAASFVLAAMILPIVTAVSRDMILAVPRHQRDAALALGATPWEVTWKVVLPNARPGIVAATILGFGRALGETMAIILVMGNQPLLPHSLFDPGASMASIIASEFGEAKDLHKAALFELGLILLVSGLLINLAARGVVRRLSRRIAGA